MKRSDFQQMMRDEVNALVAINQTKGADYSPDEDDALSFFTELAGEVGLTQQQVWSVLATKHWQAVLTYCKRAHDDGYEPSEEVRGRILDLILYLFLLLGISKESDLRSAFDCFDVRDQGAVTIDPDADYVIRLRAATPVFWTGSPDTPGGRWARYDEEAPRRIPGRAVEEQLQQLTDDCFPVLADAPLAAPETPQ